MSNNAQLNFLPEDYLERRRQQRTNILCLSLFAVVMAGVIGAFVLQERRSAMAAREHQAVSQRMEEAARQLALIEEMQNRKEKMIRKADVTASLLERRPRHYLMALITNSLPQGSSLLSVELTCKEIKPKVTAKIKPVVKNTRNSRAAKPEPEAAAEPDKPTIVETVKVMGMAPDDKVVSRFIAALDASPLSRRVDLIFSEEHKYNEQQVRRFMLQIELDEQAAVTEEMIRSQRVRTNAFE